MNFTTSLFKRLGVLFPLSLMLAALQAQPLYQVHWDSTSSLNFSGSAATTLTQSIDSACSLNSLSVTDTANAPLPAFNAIMINPQVNGTDLVDLSGNMSFHVRVRSLDSVRLGFLLRAGDGSSAFRTNTLEAVIPGDTTAWTEVTFTFDSATIGGFDSTDLRDVWFYLDRGVENFAGNDFVFDYFAIGAAPDSNTWSTCPVFVPPPPLDTAFYEVHWTNPDDPGFSGSGGAAVAQLTDTACSMIVLSVADTANAPLPAFSALMINPQVNGTDLVDLSGNMSFHIRAKSLDSVRLGFQLRSGDGTSPFRTNLLEAIIPADTTTWTDLAVIFDANTIGGFDSTDLRDVWFFLDRGDENFAGNKFFIDYFAIGEAPDSNTWSNCPVMMPPPPPLDSNLFEVHWADTGDVVFSGSGGTALTQEIDSTCSMIVLSVTDTANAPLGAFSAMMINPQVNGSDLVDLSGNMSFHVRARSRDSVRLGFLLRAGDGSSAFRTNTLEAVIPGDTTSWTEVLFTFDANTIGGFDSTDLRDVWFYLDRGDENFAGDEFIIDYFSIGGTPDSSTWSVCPLDTGSVPPPPPVDSTFYEVHWADTGDPAFGGSGGGALTQETDTTCSMIVLSVTDTANAPLGAFNPLMINPQAIGTDIVDLSGNMSFHLRARSLDSVRLGFLLRSGDGSSAFRTDVLEALIPGDTTSWTEITVEFDANTIGGFDSTDLRDVWFYLDRGDENFAGNEFIIDYFSIGGAPDSSTWSICPLDTVSPPPPPPVDSSFYEVHWTSTADPNFSASGGSALTQVVDSVCSLVTLSVTDTTNAPLGAFSPIALNPQVNGSDLVDLSGNMSFHVRVRSLEDVNLGFLLRSGDGTSAFRTDLQEVTIPGDTTSWTELSLSFDANNIGGFDSTDLRDVWFYLDRGVENFAGNEFVFDYFSIGEVPDSSSWSTCPVDTTGNDPEPSSPFLLHWDDENEDTFGGSGGDALTQEIDTACSMLTVSVTEPILDPLGTFSPLMINPTNGNGIDLVNLSGFMEFHVRVRSEAEVTLGLLLRSGDGTTPFRTDRLEQQIPAGLGTWTELTYTFDASTIGGFDSTDLRDIWLYLDPGTANFAGNEVVFDYFAVGPKPDDSTHSTCVDVPPFNFPWVLHWADTTDQLTSGSGAVFLTQTVDTACSQLSISVTQPILDPHPAFRTIRLNPQDEFGNELQDITGQLRIAARVRSLEEVEFGVQLRGGGGSEFERSDLLTQTIPAGLDEWTEVVFNFGGNSQGGFDPADLRDIFMFLDRENPNWPGNEFQIDYISLGNNPPLADNSTCETVDIDDLSGLSVSIAPNPLRQGEALRVFFETQQNMLVDLSLRNATGQLIRQKQTRMLSNAGSLTWELPSLPTGLYLLNMQTEKGTQTFKVIIR